jgi:hypothetical protein
VWAAPSTKAATTAYRWEVHVCMLVRAYLITALDSILYHLPSKEEKKEKEKKVIHHT